MLIQDVKAVVKTEAIPCFELDQLEKGNRIYHETSRPVGLRGEGLHLWVLIITNHEWRMYHGLIFAHDWADDMTLAVEVVLKLGSTVAKSEARRILKESGNLILIKDKPYRG